MRQTHFQARCTTKLNPPLTTMFLGFNIQHLKNWGIATKGAACMQQDTIGTQLLDERCEILQLCSSVRDRQFLPSGCKAATQRVDVRSSTPDVITPCMSLCFLPSFPGLTKCPVFVLRFFAHLSRSFHIRQSQIGSLLLLCHGHAKNFFLGILHHRLGRRPGMVPATGGIRWHNTDEKHTTWRSPEPMIGHAVLANQSIPQ